jgi:succinate dehydrogenase / fumarate reductase iron-sulfur subunit
MTSAPAVEHDSHAAANGKPANIEIRILRQNGPGEPSYWERHRVPYEREMNVISVLQRIAAQAHTSDGEPVAPVAWDCNCLEEVCGACTMVINGRARQACSALVDRLLEDNPEEIELRPMSKFPVVRDLMVDRTRMFEALQKLKIWVPVDGYYDLGTSPRVSQQVQQDRYPLSECMTCGCCLEACPQYTKIELIRQDGETDEQFDARKREAYRSGFIGPHAISQVVYINLDPTGAMNANERIDAMTAEGGIQVCGNAQNCVQVCPKHIPLTRSIGRAGWAATVRTFRWFFGRG